MNINQRSVDINNAWLHAKQDLASAGAILSSFKRPQPVGHSAITTLLNSLLPCLEQQHTELRNKQTQVAFTDEQSGWAGLVSIHYNLLKCLRDLKGILSRAAGANADGGKDDGEQAALLGALIIIIIFKPNTAPAELPKFEPLFRPEAPLDGSIYLVLLEIALHAKNKWLLERLLGIRAAIEGTIKIESAVWERAAAMCDQPLAQSPAKEQSNARGFGDL